MVRMPEPLCQGYAIRDYRDGEIQRLHQIDRICFPPHMAYSRAELLFYLEHPSAICKVAESGEEVVGFALGRVERNGYGHVITLDVVPEARRRRVGTALMEALHGELRARQVSQVVLEVDVSNEAAQRFYDLLGYRRDELLRGYYHERQDAYRMILML